MKGLLAEHTVTALLIDHLSVEAFIDHNGSLFRESIASNMGAMPYLHFICFETVEMIPYDVRLAGDWGLECYRRANGMKGFSRMWLVAPLFCRKPSVWHG